METATFRSVLVYSDNATCKMVRLELSMVECAHARLPRVEDRIVFASVGWP